MDSNTLATVKHLADTGHGVREIARSLNLAPSTVSRALRGETGTRNMTAEVEELIAEGYCDPISASILRGLASKWQQLVRSRAVASGPALRSVTAHLLYVTQLVEAQRGKQGR